MKKVVRKELILILVIVAIIFLAYLFLFKPQKLWFSSCSFNLDETYTICCKEGDEAVLCSNNTLRCGEEIVVALKGDLTDSNHYLCIDRHTLVEDSIRPEYTYENGDKTWECTSKPNVAALIWTGKVPYKEGNLIIADVYEIPSHLESSSDLVWKKDSFEKVISIRREIKC